MKKIILTLVYFFSFDMIILFASEVPSQVGADVASAEQPHWFLKRVDVADTD